MQMTANSTLKSTYLLGASILALVLMTPSLRAQDSAADDGAPQGFLISVDGATVAGDTSLKPLREQARVVQDRALAKADLQVRFDGLDLRPRLDLRRLDSGQAGKPVELISELNYPAWVTRGELRVMDMGARGGPKLLSVLPITPNGTAQIPLPKGDEVAVVHRVYDRQGRYDETAPLWLSRKGDSPQNDGPQEQGTDRAALRRIPVSGGAVTVSGSVAPGAQIRTLGETLRADPSGQFVLQRILPAGDHAITVATPGTKITRDISIPRSEWFYVGLADLTFGWRDNPIGGEEGSYARGRLAGYAKGKTQGGYTITASVDTKEGPLKDIFRTLDEKDPRALLKRMDPDLYYPTYGDDSELTEGAPTSGKFFFKIERDGNHLLWGNFKSEFGRDTYLRNERTLYGLQGQWASSRQTRHGEPRQQLAFYAAQPDNLPGRDEFRGTGGSAYFLSKQDISTGSETVSILIRDGDTDRILERRVLSYGRDYDINYVQGVVTLSQPLTSSLGGGVISTPGSEDKVSLVVQYEFTPTATDLDGFAYGGRGEAWLTDQLRVGASGMVEQTGSADQTAVGVDLLYRLSDKTYARLEYAQSDGPGFGSSYSTDGGLIIDNTVAQAGKGEAVKAEVRADLQELGFGAEGHVGGYFEHRTEGFSSLDHQVTSATGDETLWGVDARIVTHERLEWQLAYDSYENSVGDHKREGEAGVKYTPNERITYELGVLHTDKNTSSDNGRRTDLGLRITRTESDRLKWWVFGQKTIDRQGLAENDRIGVGAKLGFAKGWSFEGEVSDGSLGAGGKALLSYDDGAGRSVYAGYELDPDREFSGVDLVGRDEGRFIAGGRRKVNDRLSYFGEHSYDIFGAHRSLTTSYGVEYAPVEALTYTATYEGGRIRDAINGDFDRHALSLGLRYKDSKLAAKGRVELRRDRGVMRGQSRDSDTYVVKAEGRYLIDDAQRIVFSLDAAHTETDQSSVLDGTLVDASVGYALRPVTNDRFNMLIRYRFLRDMYGQKIDGQRDPGPRQESHVFSIDANYDLNTHWTLGGKFGFRLSESAADDTSPFVQNNAWLGVINARYHMVHEWDALIEARTLRTELAQTTQYGLLGAVYRHIGDNFKLGVGYNFGRFSDDLTDLTHDDRGVFVNLVAKF